VKGFNDAKGFGFISPDEARAGDKGPEATEVTAV
jgi:cold shock CspA family protein